MPETQNHVAPFVRRVLIVAGILVTLVILFYLIGTLAQTLLVLFAGVLLAVLLDGLASFLRRRFPIPHGLALAIVVFVILLTIAAVVYFIGPRIADQIERLTVRVPQVLAQLRGSLERYQFGRMILNKLPSLGEVLPFGKRQLISAPAAFGTLFGVLVNFIIVVFIGIYLAASPRAYIDASLKLLPKNRRPRAGEVIETTNRVLRRFFIGRFASMAIVGVLSGVGYWIAGIPLAVALGLIAGLLEFVPFIGPIIAVIPALLLGLAEGPLSALYVLIVYAVVQTAESYLITPMVERYAVSIPPGALISIQIIMGAVFGVIGIFLATPLAVIVIVAIQMLYIQDVLRDDVKIIGH